jgi:hypothetical protein
VKFVRRFSISTKMYLFYLARCSVGFGMRYAACAQTAEHNEILRLMLDYNISYRL